MALLPFHFTTQNYQEASYLLKEQLYYYKHRRSKEESLSMTAVFPFFFAPLRPWRLCVKY
jgi:hypothetical protein